MSAHLNDDGEWTDFIAHDPKQDSADWLLDDEQRTENALAQRFVQRYGDKILYVPAWRKWLVWDGRRYQVDGDSSSTLELARRFAGTLWRNFHAAAEGADKRTNLDTVYSFCKQANGKRVIESIVGLSRADSRVCINVDALNANVGLLNLQNGTFDLSSNEFRPHSKLDRLTQVANVAYDKQAECPRWLSTLYTIFGGDESVLRYVQQILGYSLSADVGEHILPIAYGNGCNGKSTVWNCVLELAGDYGSVANDSLLLGDRNAHPTEKASLYQKRIIAVSEPEQGSKMRESRVKELTGDSLITARRMREDFWVFRRSHTFWLSTNHLPRVSGTDEGIWRRIKLIPFEVDLRDKVDPIPDFHMVLAKEEGPGILNWLLDGYRQYVQQGGFDEPEAVKRSGDTYRRNQDDLGEFIEECCVVGDGYYGASKYLYETYQAWGGKWSKTAFGRAMGDRYEKDVPTAGEFRRQTMYHGIAVAD